MSLRTTQVSWNRKVKQLYGLKYRALADRFWSMSKDEWMDYQRNRFLEIYEYARNFIPYYKMRGALYPELHPGGRSLEELLLELPILKKETVKKHNEQFFSTRSSFNTVRHTTSGSTGNPLRLQATMQEKGMQQAIFDTWKRRIVGTSSPRTIYLLGSIKEEGEQWLSRAYGTNEVYISIYQLRQKHKHEIIQFLHAFDPAFIQGYPSAVFQLAQLAGDSLLHRKNRTYAMVTSETLLPQWKSVIEEKLCHKVYDFYSSQEGAHGAFEGDCGSMHIHPMFGSVELIKEDGNRADIGESGLIVVTGLIRKSMPLIRYEIGDHAVKGSYHSSCSCSSSWDSLQKIEGRLGDQLLLEDGRRISMLVLNHLFHGLDGVEVNGAQLIQHSTHRFEFLIVMKERDQGSRKFVQQRFQQRFIKLVNPPSNVDLAFTFVSEIPRGANGKIKLVDVRL
ncbi:phenylacetate--CoA ligase family protein [Paenibacillus sp. 1001270B_150601_E10]|uniref:phenylacetate--CoA ligase family protein n=1 Tax=Paenibacillus sp. 1001270B_150601_E10 TaxID=2787079 RepID=UPI00189E5AEB|nr:phenylacetate--CoA ligase family protein [Paenibacillus sp. 1001270B_150601_E10]